MKQYQLKTHARQAGMTLLELTVVLFILLALAGLMIPSFDISIETRTDDSTSVSSLAEVDKGMLSYNSVFMKEPNNMEALINGTAGSSTIDTNCNATNAAVNTVYCKLIYEDYFTPLQLTSTHLISLNMAGITSLYYNNPDTTDATFASTMSVPTTLTSSNYVAQVVNPNSINPSTWTPLPTNPPATGTPTIEDYLADVFGTTADKFDSTCYDYVAFSIGDGSTLTGKLMSNAPVHYTSDAVTGPVNKYHHFVVIYQVDAVNNPSPLGGVATGLNPTVMTKGCPTGIESAKYMGSVIAGKREDGHLSGLVRTLDQTYKNMHVGG